MVDDVEVYYFGCWDQAGHFLWNSKHGQPSGRSLPVDFPCREATCDGGFLPPNMPQENGRATLVYINGWTILSFWSNTKWDSRPGCNCSFIMRGMLSFQWAERQAREAFPAIWEQFKFEVKPYLPVAIS